MSSQQTIMRFRITLEGIEPPIWRLIDVPASYSFWDLHVAIQDAMGWLDYQLHSFIPRVSGGAPVDAGESIGIPDDFDHVKQAGWEVPISRCFIKAGG